MKYFNRGTKKVKKIIYCKRFVDFFSKYPVYKGAFLLSTGTLIAQSIGILTLPIITRLYTPSDFGILAVFTSIISVITILASFRYDFALSLPKQIIDAINLFGLCILLLFINTMGLLFILFFLGDTIIDNFHLDSIRDYQYFLIVACLGGGLYNILYQWAIRERNYRIMTYTQINRQGNGAITKIVLGLLSVGPIGLIIGDIVSQIFGVGTFIRGMWSNNRDAVKNISLSRMILVAKAYCRFPILSFPSKLLNELSLKMPVLMILMIYDSKIAGLYALANTFLVVPTGLIARSVSDAFVGEASKCVRNGSSELRSVYYSTLRHLSLISIPLLGILSLTAPISFSIIFGEEWREAGYYCIPLALTIIPQFIAFPTSKLHLYGRNDWQLMYDIARFGSILLGFYVSLIFQFSILSTLTIYGLIMLIMYLVLIILNIKAISNLSDETNR